MRDLIIRNLAARFVAYADLIAQTDDEALQATLAIEKHKSIAEHLWCVIGARESYTKALLAGEWAGFNCSLSQLSQEDFQAKLQTSATEFLAAVDSIEDWTAEREELLAALAEHEVMHEGQLDSPPVRSAAQRSTLLEVGLIVASRQINPQRDEHTTATSFSPLA